MKVLAIALLVILYLFGVVFAQGNCPLPTDAEIRSDIVGYLQSQSGDAGIPFTVTLSEPVQYTCLATGTVRDTYSYLSIVANFTSVPSRPVTLVYYQRRCTSGLWGEITGDTFETSVPNNLQPPTRTDCFICTNQLGDPHHCRQCNPPCPGSGRCTNIGVCCPFFATDSTCTDNCTTSDGPNYIVNAFICTCNLTCPIGESPNANCTTCELSDICARDSPCGSNGTCTLISAPDNYTCTCDDGFNFNGVTCHECLSPHYVLNNSGNASCELDGTTNTYTCCPLIPLPTAEEAIPIWFIVTIIVLLCVIMTGCIIIVVLIVLLVGLKSQGKSKSHDGRIYEDAMTVRHHHHHHQPPVITTNIAYDSIGHNN